MSWTRLDDSDDKLDAGTASESVAIGYEPIELPHTLPGNKNGRRDGI